MYAPRLSCIGVCRINFGYSRTYSGFYTSSNVWDRSSYDKYLFWATSNIFSSSRWQPSQSIVSTSKYLEDSCPCHHITSNYELHTFNHYLLSFISDLLSFTSDLLSFTSDLLSFTSDLLSFTSDLLSFTSDLLSFTSDLLSFQCILSVLYVFGGNIQQLINGVGVSLWVFYLLVFISCIIMRVTKRKAKRPFKVCGHLKYDCCTSVTLNNN